MSTGQSGAKSEEWRPYGLDPEHIEDRRLMENCHPSHHVNPAVAGSNGRYNLVVVGAGAAGLVSAGGAGWLGGRVALIERNLLGGDCLVTGCVPSKSLIRAARGVFEINQAGEFGVAQGVPTADFGVALERMRRLRARISHHDSVQHFQEKYGVDVFLGDARFTGPETLEVGGESLRFSRAIIATGGRPAVPDIAGLVEYGFHTSETIFGLRELPQRVSIIGGGPIGCELAQVFQRYGSTVTILNQADHLLPREERQASSIIEEQLRTEGVVIEHRVKIRRIEAPGRIIFLDRHQQEQQLEAGTILVAVGRTPNIDGLNLEAAGIASNADGVMVDDYLRTSNRRIYAAGDVCSTVKFTHLADAMARIAIRNALLFGRERLSRLVVPRVTYTDPEIAQVGCNERDGQRTGVALLSLTARLDDNDRAIIDGGAEGYIRIIIEQNSGRIRGGTIVARHAGEMIGQLTLAITEGLRIGALARTIQPYPTLSDSLRRLADTYELNRIGPWKRQLIRQWLSWTR